MKGELRSMTLKLAIKLKVIYLFCFSLFSFNLYSQQLDKDNAICAKKTILDDERYLEIKSEIKDIICNRFDSFNIKGISCDNLFEEKKLVSSSELDNRKECKRKLDKISRKFSSTFYPKVFADKNKLQSPSKKVDFALLDRYKLSLDKNGLLNIVKRVGRGIGHRRSNADIEKIRSVVFNELSDGILCLGNESSSFDNNVIFSLLRIAKNDRELFTGKNRVQLDAILNEFEFTVFDKMFPNDFVGNYGEKIKVVDEDLKSCSEKSDSEHRDFREMCNQINEFISVIKKHNSDLKVVSDGIPKFSEELSKTSFANKIPSMNKMFNLIGSFVKFTDSHIKNFEENKVDNGMPRLSDVKNFAKKSDMVDYFKTASKYSFYSNQFDKEFDSLTKEEKIKFNEITAHLNAKANTSKVLRAGGSVMEGQLDFKNGTRYKPFQTAMRYGMLVSGIAKSSARYQNPSINRKEIRPEHYENGVSEVKKTFDKLIDQTDSAVDIISIVKK